MRKGVAGMDVTCCIKDWCVEEKEEIEKKKKRERKQGKEVGGKRSKSRDRK